jgi:hypothetical protein
VLEANIMGSWDEVCVICGISPSSDPRLSGPCWLLWASRGAVGEIATEVMSINEDDSEEILSIVEDAVSLPIYNNGQTIDHLRKLMPGLCDWSGFKRCMAIGQFDHDGDATLIEPDGKNTLSQIPDGRQVVVRLVEGYNSATFNKVLKVVEDDATEEPVPFAYSSCSAFEGNPNFFVSEGCYHYLHAWLDWTALPLRKQAFPSDPAPLFFGAELYEIVNSKDGSRGD